MTGAGNPWLRRVLCLAETAKVRASATHRLRHKLCKTKTYRSPAYSLRACEFFRQRRNSRDGALVEVRAVRGPVAKHEGGAGPRRGHGSLSVRGVDRGYPHSRTCSFHLLLCPISAASAHQTHHFNCAAAARICRRTRASFLVATLQVCTECGKPCRSETERDIHTKRTGHSQFTDKTNEAAKPIVRRSCETPSFA